MALSCRLLNSTAKVYRVSHTRDSFGDQIQTETAVYDSLRVSIARLQRNAIEQSQGALEDFQSAVRIYTNSLCHKAKRGDRIVTEGITYKITRITPRRDFRGSIHHVEFLCEEME